MQPNRIYKLLLIISALVISGELAALDQEFTIKAGFLFNFARFSNLAEQKNKNREFSICSPDERFTDVAQSTLKNRTIKGHKLVIKVVTPETVEFKECHALFITQQTHQQWHTWLSQPPKKQLLVVGETKDFIQQGGHISFFVAGTKVRFEISPEHLKSCNIQMSSKVLRLGRIRGGS